MKSVWPLAFLSLLACQPSNQHAHFIKASIETEAVNSNGDAADDPALWVHPEDHENSLILGTQKKQGLYSYTLNGQIQQFLPVGRLNNVDVRQHLSINGQTRDMAAASNRSNNTISMFDISNSGELKPNTDIQVPSSQFAEVYGFCMGWVNDTLYMVMTGKNADAELYRLNSEIMALEVIRTLPIPSQSEGCVINDTTGDLYIGEEASGVWRFNVLDNEVGGLIIQVDDKNLVADVEGLALIKHQDQTFLMVSSQGNSSYPIYNLANNRLITVIAVEDSATIDGVSGTDGIDVNQHIQSAQWPKGVFISQDDVNPDHNQNFKVMDLRDVLKLLH